MSQQPPYPPQGGYYGYQQPGQQAGHQQPPPGQYQQPPQGQHQQPPPGQYQQPPQGQYQQPPPGQYQQPPPGQYQQPPPGQYQQPPPGQYQQPPPGQYQQPPQGQYQQPPPQGWGQPPAQQYGQAPPHGQYPNQAPPPQGYPGQYPPQQQWQQGPPPPQGQYPPPQQGYPGQGPPPGHPPGSYGAPQWQQGPPQPAPASPGYDQAQRQWLQPFDTSADAEALRKAMKGMGCDERALIRVLTQPKYSNPWAVHNLIQDYNKRFMRDLQKDIKSETRGTFEEGLLALLRGPLENDIYTLNKAMDRAGTDEVAVADVLLCRTNADIRAIAAEYRRVKGRDLLSDIKSEFSETLFRMYSMVLAATRAEPLAPVVPQDIDHKASELHRATEGMIGANALSVAQIFTSSSEAQLRALGETYKAKYRRSLEDVVEKEFRGDVEDALLRMLHVGQDRARADADWLKQPMARTLGVKQNWLIYRVTYLYWDRQRLEAAKQAYQHKFGRPLTKEVKDALSSDFEDLVLALVGEKKH